jgi:hypothetical protein
LRLVHHDEIERRILAVLFSETELPVLPYYRKLRGQKERAGVLNPRPFSLIASRSCY